MVDSVKLDEVEARFTSKCWFSTSTSDHSGKTPDRVVQEKELSKELLRSPLAFLAVSTELCAIMWNPQHRVWRSEIGWKFLHFGGNFTALHRGFRIPTQGFLGEILGEVSRLALSSLVLWVKQFWFFYFGSKSTKFLTGKGRTRARPWRGGLERAHGSVSFTFLSVF